MRRLFYPAICLAVIASVLLVSHSTQSAPDPNVASTEPRSPADEQKGFHLPPGFAIELVAAEPAIRKPINFDFDDRGRIWVTESTEYPFPAPQGRKPNDVVKILESTKGDGVADKVTVFADGLNIPIGVMPIGNGAIIHSIPNVWRMADTKGTDVADKRDVLLGTVGFNDTHGMTGNFLRGFDGWVYATHGFSNTSTLKGVDGSTIKMHSGNTYRFKPDGTHLEQFTWGQVNPFGLCLDHRGDLFSADCETKPIYMMMRGGYYPSFGKPHDGLGFAPEMCDHKHGSTAIAGVTIYEADHFPEAYRGTAFLGNVVTCRINHDKMEKHGSTYKAIEQPDFLTSDDPWFRPVCIKLGPDGALYVADFYNRIIGHYEVPLTHPGRDRERGRIWRIVYKGTDGQEKPKQPRADWAKATVPELVADLGHANLTVRLKATNQLAEREKEAVKAEVMKVMQPSSNPFQRMHGMWVLERQGILAEDTLTALAADKEGDVRVHAMRVLSEKKELTPKQFELVRAGLRDPDAFVKRCAADALGQHASAENVSPLLELLAKVPGDDTHLRYTLRMALRDQFRDKQNWAKLPQPWSEANARALADVAPGLPTAEAGSYLAHHVEKFSENGERLATYVRHATRHAPKEDVTALVTFARGDKPTQLRHQALLFRAIQQGTQERGDKLSDQAQQWADQLTVALLATKEGDLLQAGTDIANSLKLASAQAPLATLAKNKDLPEGPRRSALTALAGIDPRAHIALLGAILTDPSEHAQVRDHAANVLAGVNQPEAQAELIKAMPSATARLQGVIAAGLAGSPEGIDKLLEAVTAGKASARLLQDRQVEVKLSQSKVPNLKERIAKLTQGLPPAEQRIQELINKRRDNFGKAQTDVAKGAMVFEKSCAICHTLAGKGAKVGPQLDGVGIRGLERLLEDIIDPNRNVDQAFRATLISLKNGQTLNGLVLREEGEVVILADPQGKEVRVPKNTIEERIISQLSPMPANLVDQIPEPDFHNLLAYLLSQRAPANPSPK